MIKSAEEFIYLRKSQNPDLYRRAAMEAAPDHVWIEVIDNFPEMRKWVAHNKSVPVHILRRLSEDSDPAVRMTVAQVRRTEPDVLIKLAQDIEPDVRKMVAYNKKVPKEALEILVQDPWEQLANLASRKLKEL